MFQVIELSKITPSAFNPRKKFEGPKFDELIASIRGKGVLQPILVRPISGDNGIDHEIVAGERRYRASLAAEKTDIPCVVRDIDDDTAFEMLMIENLNREDLTELEEAQGFKMYLDKHGEGAVEHLAEKVSCKPSYIRRRVAILVLPKWVLKAWDKGELKFGHVELLSRLNSKEVKGWVKTITDQRLSVKRFEEQLRSQAPELKKAPFDLEASGCLQCGKNSDVQKKLFDVDSEKTLCLDRRCFKQQVNNYLSSKKGKRKSARHGTNGFRFQEDMGYFSQSFHNGAPKSCKDCEKLVSLIDIYGKVSNWDKVPVCAGDEECYEKNRRSVRKSTATGSGSGSGSGIGKEERAQQRQEQRSLEFWERFIKEEIPRRLKPDDDLSRRLALIALLLNNWELRDDFAARYGFEEKDSVGDNLIMDKILSLDPDSILGEFQYFALEAMATLDKDVLLKAAQHAGIDLKSDFVISKDYLDKMTKPELMALGEESQLNIWGSKEVTDFIFEILGKKRNAKPGSLKKDELIRCFLESGVDLKGKVPTEIYQLSNDG